MEASPVRALIDGHMLGCREGGNETYIRGLVNGFSELRATDESGEITVLLGQSVSQLRLPENLAYTRLKSRSDMARVLWEIPRLCTTSSADVLHVTYNASMILPCQLVVTVHDVIFRHFPHLFSPRVWLLLNTLLPLTMARADAIITGSEASRRDIVRCYPYVQGKLTVIPGAAGPVVSADPDFELAHRYTNGQPFILTVGRLDPRKNTARLVQAYIQARDRNETSQPLIIVGRPEWSNSPLYGYATDSVYRDDIRFTGYLRDEVLAALYRECSVFIYPSLYEGFGLPVLEAMACGAPVITSNTSSLPEVAGDAAILVDPKSTRDIRAALAGVVNDVPVQDRLRDAGLVRAGRFSWTKAAQSTLDVYRSTHTR